ncbi:hypothetical protein [Metallibacterium sp.]|uniref:hypothetical protein n=1 Tax=Metallibacterium sp. TaxID=2940281 RepID=UPI00260C25B1|nr:hypothetical protein [Metallibacterium sp.]
MTSHLGALVLLIDSAFPDPIVGMAIGLYVIREAIEILREAREADAAATAAIGTF